MASGRRPVTLPGPGWPGITSFVSTRDGGVSAAPYASWNLGDHVGDDPASVAENRRRLSSLLPGGPLWLQQVHGVDVIDADAPRADMTVVPCGDAAITQTPNQVLAIMTADCLPVLVASVGGRTLAMAHAGWRGLAAGVLERTVDAVRAAAGDVPLRAWIGPAIGPSAFEVGDEVRREFVQTDPGATACFLAAETSRPNAIKWLADLPELARRRLHAVGVTDVGLSGWCTVSEPNLFFSYRRDGQTGRFATVAWINGQS